MQEQPIRVIEQIIQNQTSHSCTSPYASAGCIQTFDSRLNELIERTAEVEYIADGFIWTEGPVWLHKNQMLVFSDVPANTAYCINEVGRLDRFLAPSGYTGPFTGSKYQGSNGLAIDQEGRLLICQHGDRRVSRLEDLNTFKTLADSFNGKRFNSPNDICCMSDGTILFTDPTYGLDGTDQQRELDFCGVYRISPCGKVSLVTDTISFPNGIALSPDETTLYVSNSDENSPVIYSIPIGIHSTEKPSVFFDTTPLSESLGIVRAPDGLTVDEQGNIWSTGPGGVLIISPEGMLLGLVRTSKTTANCTFGGTDGTTLFIAASESILQVRTKTKSATH